ncbi:MAG: hypothetical protein PHD14_01110 [Dehalococcoidales bacterium]|jgi:hypothetical protein|nr:hypothetical protein [Dehalococcoidales bacterium]NLT28500.1 hypothetical protein [Dehalococcoidales bacterium]
MSKRNAFIAVLAIVFIALSVIIYFIHYLVFQDAHHIFIFMLGDLAFLPLEVLLVSVIIEHILNRREKQDKLQKLNMVIGTFFSEVGNDVLRDLLVYFRNSKDIARHLNIKGNWTKQDFQTAREYADKLKIDIDYDSLDFNRLRDVLSGKRDFLLTMLGNPGLLENDRFTDLLWAVTHLAEELKARPCLDNLPVSDLKHLSNDIQRFYDHLASEWLDYAEHLKANYPYLFSLVLRTHPFQESPSAIVK